jgi:hypothetical protein
MIEILPTSFIQKQYAANKKYILYKWKKIYEQKQIT